jgi:hypothetical protein
MRWREHPRKRNVRLAAAVLALWCTFGRAEALAEASPSRVVRDVHKRGRYPSDLSVMPAEPTEASGSGSGAGSGIPPVQPRIPVRLYRSGGSDQPPPVPTSDMSIPSFGLFGTILGWILVGGAALLLVAGLVYGLAQLRFKRPAAADEKTKAKTEGTTEAALDPLLAMPELSAEELARLGRYREAIHALLVSGLFSTGFRPEGRARGLTAREIVKTLESADIRKAPLASLLESTELVWFGGRTATQDAYERARAMHASVIAGAPR